MKSRKISSKIAHLFFLLALVIFPAANGLPQSGQTNKTESVDFSKLETYEYIEPTGIKNFIKNLNEFGSKGYRVRDITQIPFSREVGNDIALMTMLAGVVRLDETKYEYKVIAVEETADLAAELYRESKEGFNVREIITYTSSLGFAQEEDDEMFKGLQDLLSMPQTHNLVLIEREPGKTSAPRQFQVLKAGYGFGKKPSEKMQSLLDESAKERFFPVGFYYSSGFVNSALKKKSWQMIDNYFGVILEKSEEKEDFQIQFVRASLHSSFKKRVNELAQQGYRIGNSRFMEGLMYKNQETAALPVAYQWLNTNSKTFADDLLKLSAAGAKLDSAVLHLGFVSSVLTESNLIFEQSSANDSIRYEYQALKMVSDLPQPILIAKTIIPPEEPIRKFRRLIRQGYTFKNLVFSNQEVMALFERRRLEIKND